MALSQSNREMLLQQYKDIRSEIDKSVFIQYEVIRVGALVLGSLLVFIPASFTAFAQGKLALLSFTLVSLAFISLSFVFIMGAGEIRIARAAAFCNRLLESLLRDSAPEAPIDKTLMWDYFSSNGMPSSSARPPGGSFVSGFTWQCHSLRSERLQT